MSEVVDEPVGFGLGGHGNFLGAEEGGKEEEEEI
jgi:hypothetical protein